MTTKQAEALDAARALANRWSEVAGDRGAAYAETLRRALDGGSVTVYDLAEFRRLGRSADDPAWHATWYPAGSDAWIRVANAVESAIVARDDAAADAASDEIARAARAVEAWAKVIADAAVA